MTQAFIDLSVLGELRESAGHEFTTELAQTFAEDAAQMLATLRASREAGDAVAFRRTAHSLKANANTFGALTLASMARTLEQSDVASVDAGALVQLDEQCRGALTALQELCRE